MVKFKAPRLQFLLVGTLLTVALSTLVGNVYSSLEPHLTGDEQAELREQRYADLGHGAAPDEKMLKEPLDKVMTGYNDSMACASDTGLKDAAKSREKNGKSLHGAGGIKKPLLPTKMPESSPCSDTHKKMMAKQARYGAKTAGLSEGKNGAPTQASDPGSVNQTALASQNRLKQLEMTLTERNQTAALLNRGCAEGRFECPETSQASRGWLLPVAMAATATLNNRDMQSYASEQAAATNAAYKMAQTTEKRMGEELAGHDQFKQLSQLIQLQMDKQQEINAKAEIMKQAALKLEEKMDQGGASHNCSSVTQTEEKFKSRPWALAFEKIKSDFYSVNKGKNFNCTNI